MKFFHNFKKEIEQNWHHGMKYVDLFGMVFKKEIEAKKMPEGINNFNVELKHLGFSYNSDTDILYKRTDGVVEMKGRNIDYLSKIKNFALKDLMADQTSQEE